jgi:hypothetical protein
VKKFGGECLKFTSSTQTGIPDRIVVLPKGRVAFVELKRPKGGRVEDLQKYQIKKLRKLGCHARVVKSFTEIEELLSEMLGDEYVEGRERHGVHTARVSEICHPADKV